MELHEAGKRLTQEEWDQLPSQLQVLKMLGMNVVLLKIGCFKASWWIDNDYYEFYSPMWYRHHGKADQK